MIERHTLKNGIRVLAQNRPDSFSTSVLGLVKTGSRNEDEDISGISHFIEHMAFKGTKRRPSAIAISKEVDSMGASWNASTGREITTYQIKADNRHFENSLDILNDIAFHSLFAEKDVKKEKGAIVEEINMYEDDPGSLVYNFFDKIIYKNVRMAREVLGTRDSVSKVTENKIKLYHDKYYRAGNVVVSLVGNLPKDYLELIDEHFHSVSKGITDYKKESLNPSYDRRVYLKSKDTEQTHAMLGVEAFAQNDKDRYALNVLTTILGGYTSSRLWDEIREKRGLAYAIWSGVHRGSDTGFLVAKAGLNTDRAEEAIRIMKDELLSIADTVDEEEVMRAKDNIKGMMALSEENSMTVAGSTGRKEILGEEVLTLEQRMKKFEKITRQDIKRVADKFIKQDKMKLAIIGPFQDEQKFVKILER